MSVTMFYRVCVTDFNADLAKCGYDFGEIKSRHKDAFTADRAASKASKGDSSPSQMAFELTTDEKLEVGDKPVELVWNAYIKCNRQREVRKCADIMEKMKTGESAEEACKYLVPLDEYNRDMEFDEWCDKFSESAQKLIEENEKRIQQKAEEEAKRASIVSSFESAASEMTYSFPAVKGIQAKKEFYIAQVPFKYLVKFFTFADESLPAELRAQRKVNIKHANEIGQYVVDNREDYVLPCLTVSVNEAMVFDPLNVNGLADRLGVIRIPLTAKLLINDGQHRRQAAEFFMKYDKTLGDETVPVTFYYDEGLERSKQIFADLNANLSKPSAAINALYDLRNPFNKFVLDALERHPEINELVDKEQTTIGGKSEKVWSLVHWKKFVEKLLNAKEKSFINIDDEKLDSMNQFFDLVLTELTGKIRLWQKVINNEISSEELRNYNVAGHAVFLESVALALSGMCESDEETVKEAIDKIASVPTAKDASHWNNRCVVAGRMVKTVDSVKVTAAYLRQVAELDLSESMKEAVSRHGLAA